MFKKTLEHVLAWSAHPRAPLYLGAVSFAESSFFPIPPDVLLAPMVLSRPEQAWRLATWTTLCSVFGGVAAFTVATFAGDAVAAVLHGNGYGESYVAAQGWFATWGFWAVLVAGFSPIPYKVFAFAAGGMSMLLPAFILASIAGRGGRFFLVGRPVGTLRVVAHLARVSTRRWINRYLARFRKKAKGRTGTARSSGRSIPILIIFGALMLFQSMNLSSMLVSRLSNGITEYHGSEDDPRLYLSLGPSTEAWPAAEHVPALEVAMGLVLTVFVGALVFMGLGSGNQELSQPGWP